MEFFPVQALADNANLSAPTWRVNRMGELPSA
jgi:hypothetical protein